MRANDVEERIKLTRPKRKSYPTPPSALLLIPQILLEKVGMGIRTKD